MSSKNDLDNGIQRLTPSEVTRIFSGMSPLKATRYYNRIMTNPNSPAQNIDIVRQYREQNPHKFLSDDQLRGNRGQKGSWMYGKGYGSGYGGQYRDRRNGRVYDDDGFSYDAYGRTYDRSGNETGGWHDGGPDPSEYGYVTGDEYVRQRSRYNGRRGQFPRRRPVSEPRSIEDLYRTVSGLNGGIARTRYFIKVMNNPETPEETKQNLAKVRNRYPGLFADDEAAIAAGPQVQRSGFWAAHWKSQEEFDSMSPKEKKFFVKAFQGRNRNGNSSYALRVLTNPDASPEDKAAITSVVQKNPDLYFKRKGNGRNPYNRYSRGLIMNEIVRVSAAAIALIAVLSGIIILSEGADGYSSVYTVDLEVGEAADVNLTDLTGAQILFLYSGTLPEGLELEILETEKHLWWSDHEVRLRGTPTCPTGSYSFVLCDDSYMYEFKVSIFAGECTVTYDAGMGLVHGRQVWSETITRGSYASLPQAAHSSGAYTFAGWGLSDTSASPLESYAATSDVTLHAIWTRNTVLLSDSSATVTSGQTAELPLHANPADASIDVSSYGGLPEHSVEVDGDRLLLDMSGVEPGTYYVTLTAGYTGYISGDAVVTVSVPITIVRPIEYVLSVGDKFSYTPVTNPTNASISLDEAALDGAPFQNLGGFAVSGRTITGIIHEAGTYSLTYTASLDGYVDVTNVVRIKAVERAPDAPAPVMGSISASPRVNESRVYDFAVVGHANASNIVWSVGTTEFASSSQTALYEFPASGIYTVTCTITGFDGSSVSDSVQVLCMDNYHRESAWVGVLYSYIIEGNVDLLGSGPFGVEHREISGQAYTIVTGTPSEYDAGDTFRISGGDSWTISVFNPEAYAPVVDFDLVVGSDGFTVVAVWKGSNTSSYGFDFDGDGILESGNAHTYQKPGRYTVLCRAANNVSETSASKYVDVSVVPHEEVDLSQITDFQMMAGEKLDIRISLSEGEVLTVGGSAAAFCTVSSAGIRVEPTEPGVYSLTVSVHDGSSVHSKTVSVTVRGDQVQELEEKNHDYAVILAVFFGISVVAVAVFVLRDIRPRTPRRRLR